MEKIINPDGNISANNNDRQDLDYTLDNFIGEIKFSKKSDKVQPPAIKFSAFVI